METCVNAESDAIQASMETTIKAELASMRALLELVAAAVVPVGPRNEDGSF